MYENLLLLRNSFALALLLLNKRNGRKTCCRMIISHQNPEFLGINHAQKTYPNLIRLSVWTFKYLKALCKQPVNIHGNAGPGTSECIDSRY